MSCSGQSLDTHNTTIAVTKATICLRVTGGVPSGTARGPITRTM